MRLRKMILIALLASVCARSLEASETVGFQSGDKTLHGVLHRPKGTGPFPVVLFNHGSAAGMENSIAFDTLGPIFAAHGWAFFAPYRRGQGLSSDAGPYIGDEINAARSYCGLPEAARTMTRLLSTDHFQDQMSALAWVKHQPFARPMQIAALGNSFGGIETVLGAAQGGYCAAVDAAGGAESWDVAPSLQILMVHAVRNAARAWIEDVVVDSEARGLGVGEALVTAAVSLGKQRGAKTIDLTSRQSRQAAHRLYEKVGFQVRDTSVYRYVSKLSV